MKNKLTETKFKSALGLTCYLIGRALCLGAVMLICTSALAQNPAPLEPGSKSLSHLDSGTWTYTGSLNTVRRSHTATLLPNGMVLVAGGFAPNSVFASAELYDPASGTWTPTGSLHTGRRWHTASLLPNGMVLVAGGVAFSGPFASAELYDPASGTWTATGSLGTARYLHTTTLLPNGKVLVAGGGGSSGTLASAELYDPASGTWTPTGSLHTARREHTATLLPNGMVLVAGGYKVVAGGVGHTLPLASAELYDPASGTWTP